MENFETLCVHPVNGKEEGSRGSVTGVIYPATAYDYTNGEELQYPGFYSAYNQKRLARIIANLEKGDWGVVFSSGMAAISTAILSFARQNDHIVFSKDLYGGTWSFAEKELPKRNISCSYADNTPESFAAQIRENTRVIYIETPSNPLLKIVPLKAVAELAKRHGIVTIVDNTFASPVNQLPLKEGIDISVHSGTKYLGGHNDLPYGALVSNIAAHREPILTTAKMYGGSLSPDQCYLAERSLKTLALRIERQNQNALTLAKWLAAHPAVKKVYYPGLPDHPGHSIAQQQMKGFGGMLSFELDIPPNKLPVFLNNLRVVHPALSLGGVESLICSPAVTSHRYLTPEERKKVGVTDSLFRFSAGIEHIDDLVGDLDAAIAAAQKG
ncbi:MAG TPA: PLP-dependent aspartate aminotransferase family protein [Flavitalea sp.]|nr:PLP-dependent aspartate aminotransferase family protein [Flavitalea sp.]